MRKHNRWVREIENLLLVYWLAFVSLHHKLWEQNRTNLSFCGLACSTSLLQPEVHRLHCFAMCCVCVILPIFIYYNMCTMSIHEAKPTNDNEQFVITLLGINDGAEEAIRSWCRFVPATNMLLHIQAWRTASYTPWCENVSMMKTPRLRSCQEISQQKLLILAFNIC